MKKGHMSVGFYENLHCVLKKECGIKTYIIESNPIPPFHNSPHPSLKFIPFLPPTPNTSHHPPSNFTPSPPLLSSFLQTPHPSYLSQIHSLPPFSLKFHSPHSVLSSLHQTPSTHFSLKLQSRHSSFNFQFSDPSIHSFHTQSSLHSCGPLIE